MRISDWSSDVCSSRSARADFFARHGLEIARRADRGERRVGGIEQAVGGALEDDLALLDAGAHQGLRDLRLNIARERDAADLALGAEWVLPFRSEEHTSELQSLMRISYAVFCLKKKTAAQS